MSSKQVILGPPLPKLLVYDHCPFCVRVRLAFGIKNIKHELYFLANDGISKQFILLVFTTMYFYTCNPQFITPPLHHTITYKDVATPTAYVGKKIAPIFSFEGVSMPESLDIIAKVDQDPLFGTVNVFKPMSGRKVLFCYVHFMPCRQY